MCSFPPSLLHSRPENYSNLDGSTSEHLSDDEITLMERSMIREKDGEKVGQWQKQHLVIGERRKNPKGKNKIFKIEF